MAFIAFEALALLFIEINIGVKLILYVYAVYVFHRTILMGNPFSGAPGQDARLPRRDWPETPGWRL